jgi:hypothetical protein
MADKQATADDTDALEQLYSVEPEEFVAERRRLERVLREQGRDEEAADIAGRRKPTLPVHAANRLARARADDVAALIAAAEQIASAHESGEAEQLRRAQAELAQHVRGLVGGSEKAAGRSLSDDAEQRLATLLRAAAVDPETAPLLRRGVLAEEVEPSGFDALAGLSLAAPSAGSRRARPAETKDARQEAKRREKIDRLERELADARDALRSAEAELDTAQREADRARRRVGDAEKRLERAQDTV